QIMETAGLTDQEDMDLIYNVMYHTSDWSLMDWGYLDEYSMEELIKTRVPERLYDAVHRLLFHWWDHIFPVEGMADLIREYKGRGLNIYLISNATCLLKEYFPHIPGSECFSDLVVSADVKLIKPMHEIYELAIKRFNVVPQESVFVDDLISNIAAARTCGMHGFVFKHNVRDLHDYIESLLEGKEDLTGAPIV
nr:HAD-IA family hydrolase [Sphaerochaetaceae bacterium]